MQKEKEDVQYNNMHNKIKEEQVMMKHEQIWYIYMGSKHHYRSYKKKIVK